MYEWVSLKEFLEHEKTNRHYIYYKPDMMEVRFRMSETGWKKTQKFSTQKDFGWNAFVTKEGDIYLAADAVTSTALVLHDKKGYDNAIELIKRWSSIYGNKDFEAEGVALTEDLFEPLMAQVRNIEDKYYMAKQYEERGELHSRFNQMYVEKDRIWHTELYSNIGANYTVFGIRPIVRLSQDTLVDVKSFYFDGSSKERALQLKYHNYSIDTTPILLKVLEDTRDFASNIENELQEI